MEKCGQRERSKLGHSDVLLLLVWGDNSGYMNSIGDSV